MRQCLGSSLLVGNEFGSMSSNHAECVDDKKVSQLVDWRII
jgi:hypothetical protein